MAKRKGRRARDGVFSLFLSSFPRGWIFKGSGLNLRSGIRGRRVSQSSRSLLLFFLFSFPFFFPISSLFIQPSEASRGKERRDAWRTTVEWGWGGGEITDSILRKRKRAGALHVSLNILRSLSALDRGNSGQQFSYPLASDSTSVNRRWVLISSRDY